MQVKNNCYHLTQELLVPVLKRNASHTWEVFIQLFCKFYFVKQLCFLPSTGEFESFDVRRFCLGIYMNEILGSVYAKPANSVRQDIIDILLVVKLCKFNYIGQRVQFLLTTIKTLPICHTPA
jgi:hypothetical protein